MKSLPSRSAIKLAFFDNPLVRLGRPFDPIVEIIAFGRPELRDLVNMAGVAAAKRPRRPTARRQFLWPPAEPNACAAASACAKDRHRKLGQAAEGQAFTVGGNSAAGRGCLGDQSQKTKQRSQVDVNDSDQNAVACRACRSVLIARTGGTVMNRPAIRNSVYFIFIRNRVY